MVASDVGADAIRAYLGLSRDALDDALVRLGLRTPSDKALRPGGRFAWSVRDVMRVIYWRILGVHPETIALRLTELSGTKRTANAVRAKCRRLGIAPPPRRELRRYDHRTLLDPPPGFALSSLLADPGLRPVAPAAEPSIEPSEQPPDIVTPLQPSPAAEALGTDENQIESHLAQEPSAAALTVAVLENMPESRNLIAADQPQEVGQPKGSTRAGAAPPGPKRVRSLNPPRRSVIYDADIVRQISMRHFGGQHPKYTAQELGLTLSQLYTIRHRSGLPLPLGRYEYRETHDPELAEFNLARCKHKLKQEPPSDLRPGRWFWQKIGSGDAFSRWTHKCNGTLDDDGKYFLPRFDMLTRADLDASGKSSSDKTRGSQYEKLQCSRHAPPVGSGVSGGTGYKMPGIDARHGRTGGGVAHA